MQKIKSYIISLTIFLLPLFFLPITHEFYHISKFMLIAVSAIILISISGMQLFKTRVLHLSKKTVRILIPLLIFLLAVSTSIIIGTTSQIQALFNYNYGPLLLLGLTIMFWYSSKEENSADISQLFLIGGACLSIITIVLFFRPFSSLVLPKTFQFLGSKQFSPIGTQTDLVLYLGFLSLYQFVHIYKLKKITYFTDWVNMIGVGLSVLALVLSLSNLVSGSALEVASNTATHRQSVQSATKTLSSPTEFFTGVGLNNFSIAFTKIKDYTYNNSPQWKINSIDNASSAFLQILVETGIFGTLALAGIFFSAFYIVEKKEQLVYLLYLSIAFFIFPTSLILFFLLYLSLGNLIAGMKDDRKHSVNLKTTGHLFLISFFIAISLAGALTTFIFVLLPYYRAEMAMRSSVDAIANRNWKDLYAYQYNAVALNHYIERYRVNFSQTNLFLAKQIRLQTNPDQKIVSQLVQKAINEAQAAIVLNPKRASNWENLGVIYKSVKGAEQWAIASFQKAISLDPQNVSYRLELGGVYYSLKQYENAVKVFQEVTLLKPDLPNAYYNLAHSYFQSRNNEKALRTMDTLLALLKKQSSPDYQKVLKERQSFVSGLPQNQAPTVIQ